ncbi:cytosolic phospholipase A2 gamma-like [Clinocottus analis]|uniref:cytosolic phospholipase A2 gamma-like n=1 Tax=Clinocottus analis TaxID=304258 RepID=UPI0035BFD954
MLVLRHVAMRGPASWALLCAGVLMLGPTGRPADAQEARSQTRGLPRGQRTPTHAATDRKSPGAAKLHGRRSQLTSAAERAFVLKRKEVVVEALRRMGMPCTLSSAPHIAVLGSGGGQRAAVGLVGSLFQMQEEGLLGTLLYLGGVSGSALSMSSLYSDPQWSSNMGRAVSRLSGPGVPAQKALDWLGRRAEDEQFSLTDIWGVMTSAAVMKQLDHRHLSEDGLNAFNPYPVYNAANTNCLHSGPVRGTWFEMSPHEAGFTDLGFFLNTSRLGRDQEAERGGEGPEMDMIRLQGIVSSIVADERSLVNNILHWLKGVVAAAATDTHNLLDVLFHWTEVPRHINKFWDVLDRYVHGFHSLLKLTEEIRTNTDDPAVLSGLDHLQNTMKGAHEDAAAWSSWSGVCTAAPRRNPSANDTLWEALSNIVGSQGDGGRLSLSPTEGRIKSQESKLYFVQERKNHVTATMPLSSTFSLLIQKVIPLLWKWEWGTTKNFLYQHPGAAVPPCIKLEEHLQLMDASVVLNMPYPPFLGQKRDADLLIALDYGADGAFKTLTLAREYALAVKKPFPEIDDKFLKETDWPEDCYVLEGKKQEPTIVYMPLFNRHNCKDAEEVKAKMKDFCSVQLPFSQEKIEFVLETAKANIKKNKDTLLREIHKAVLRRTRNI